MSFLYPLVLLSLAAPVALLVWVWRRAGQPVVLPLDHGRPGRGWAWRISLNLVESIPPLLLAIVICLLAGPQRYDEPESKRKLTNIELCLDISGSMTAQFGEGSRYDAAMKAMEEFVNYRKGDALGLTFFGNSFLHWCPLTSDTSAVLCAPPFMRPENVPHWFGGTEIGKALRACKTVLVQRQEGERMIVLLTDGDSSDLYGEAAESIAKEMKENDITVFAVIIGMTNIQNEILTITQSTGGDAFLAADPEALSAMFKRVDQLKQMPMEKKLADSLDWFRPFCAVGLCLLGVLSLAALILRYTPW